WMNRVIRRAIFGSIALVGSKSRTSAAIWTSNADGSKLRIRRVPVTPATRLDQYVGKSLPIGMTAPRPVTTARRAGSTSGKTDHLRDGHRRIVVTDPAPGRKAPAAPNPDARVVCISGGLLRRSWRGPSLRRRVAHDMCKRAVLGRVGDRWQPTSRPCRS